MASNPSLGAQKPENSALQLTTTFGSNSQVAMTGDGRDDFTHRGLYPAPINAFSSDLTANHNVFTKHNLELSAENQPFPALEKIPPRPLDKFQQESRILQFIDSTQQTELGLPRWQTDVLCRKTQLGLLQRLKLIKENGLSGRGAVSAGKNSVLSVKPSFGEDLNFRWIDDEIGETEKNLQKQLFTQGDTAAILRKFRQNPTDCCYEAMIVVFNSLKKQSERIEVIGILFYKNPWDVAPTNHFAVVLAKDNAEFVVDPTIRQFDPALPDESTITTFAEWKALMINKSERGKDSIILMKTYSSPLAAKYEVACLHTSMGKYYQSPLINKDSVNLLKYGDSLASAIIKDIRRQHTEQKTLDANSVSYSDAKQNLVRLEVLKSLLSIYSPDEVKPTELISSGFKRKILNYLLPTTEISALRSIGDNKSITTTVSGKLYIRINNNGWINIEKSLNSSSSYWLVFQGQKKMLLNFDEIKRKWVLLA